MCLSGENGQLYAEAEGWDTRTSEGNIVKVSGELDRLHFSADVELFYSPVEVRDRGVGGIVRSEDVDSLFDPVKGIDILNREDS